MSDNWTCVHTGQSVPEDEIESVLYEYVADSSMCFGDYIIDKDATKREFSFRLVSNIDELNDALLQKSTSVHGSKWFHVVFTKERCVLLEAVLGTPDGPPTRSDMWFRNTLTPDYVEVCLKMGAKNRENCEAVGKMLYQYRFYDCFKYNENRDPENRQCMFSAAARTTTKTK